MNYISMTKIARGLALTLAFLLALPVLPTSSSLAFAAQVSAIVNGVPITSTDVQRRTNFLRLQRARGNLKEKARDQLIDEILKREEVLRVGASVSTQDVEAAFQRFASNNKMSIKQLTSILNQAGVGVDHFKAFIAVSMSWPRVVSSRFGSGGMSSGELGSRLRERGEKPKTTEYILQQIIFVVPAAKRNSLMGKRQREAEASRKKYPGCDGAMAFAATMHDVAIKNLGRILEPQLPSDWKPLVVKTGEGQTTKTRRTEKGVEYLSVCKRREVSDDFAAQIVFQAEDLESIDKNGEDPNSERYLKELRSNAQIVKK